MTSTQKRRLVKARQARNQRILWAMQDALGLSLIAFITYGLGMLAWGFVA